MRNRTTRGLQLGMILVALVWLGCAGQRQTATPTESYEAYRQRILSLLESEEESKGEAQTTGAAAAQKASAGEAKQSTEPLAESLYLSTQARYEALQAKLRARQATLDSLKRVLASADREVARLEESVKEARAAQVPKQEQGASVPLSSYEEQYRANLALAERQSYKRAIAGFERLIAINRQHPLADNCQYWIGQCYFDLGRYEEAIAAFLKVFLFTATDKYDDAHLMICKSYLALGERAAARAELNSFLLHHPTSEYRSAALALLRGL
ncbi:MAG: tetratricopeptide repeat protein [Candidatus Oleimicrobiaceae bacterium]